MTANASAFADHFSAQAADYARHRPRYPAELFAWLAQESPARERAWDAGCGNGQASVGLAEVFDAVYASDPSAAQIAQCPSHPRIQFVEERAEACSLPNRSIDLLLVAQAYHWLDHARFVPEAERIVREEGLFCALSYGLCRVSPEVDALYDLYYGHIVDAYWPPERAHIENGYAELPLPGTELHDLPSFSMAPVWTLAHYRGYLSSWSATQRYKQARGSDPLATIDAALGEAWGDPQQPRCINFPLRLRVCRLR